MTERPSPEPLRAISVVVPAHDEEAALPSCLIALERTAVEVARLAPDLAITLCIVLDSCTDGSRAIADTFAAVVEERTSTDVVVLTVEEGKVGPARARGFDAVIAAAPADMPLNRLWIASTDADTIVPVHWLPEQISRADRGVDVVVGTVEPDAALDAARRAAWEQRHRLADGHSHVHGANLGMRASVYRGVGGFAPVAQHEDVDLVARLRGQEHIVVDATDATRVVTSSRSVGRAVGGFAGYLAALHDVVG